jgi:hypothetical protein
MTIRELNEAEEDLVSELVKIHLLELLNEAENLLLEQKRKIINEKTERINKLKNVLDSI